MPAMKSLLALLVCAGVAHADDWHPFVFSPDTSTLRGGEAAVEAGAGYNGLPDDKAALTASTRRIDAWIGAEVALHDRVALSANIGLSDVPGQPAGLGDLRADVLVRVLRPRTRLPLAITLGMGYQADPLLQSAITGLIGFTSDLGRVVINLDVRAAHYFHDGRDPVDVFLTFGVAARVGRILRLGVEYVGEELEAISGGDDADDTVTGRHYVGPMAALYLAGGRLRISATGGVVLANREVGPVVRGSLGWRF
jgi:hypothetical protein